MTSSGEKGSRVIAWFLPGMDAAQPERPDADGKDRPRDHHTD